MKTIFKLKKNQIFVFGSNLAGQHIGGAAKSALKWGAVMGQGEGLQGQTYAFPTLDKKFSKRTRRQLEKSRDLLYKVAEENQNTEFLLTPVGTGIAGYPVEEMADIFNEAPKNIIKPDEFPTYRWKFLREGIVSDYRKIKWTVGKWKHLSGEISTCNNGSKIGYHCSKTILQALGYVRGEVLAKVEVRGKSDVDSDKEAYSDMRVVKAFEWTKFDSVKLAIFSAELVIDIYEKRYPNDNRPRKAIEAAKAYLNNPSAYAATAAYAAATDATDAAATYAAYAAYAAASATALKEKINQWLVNHVSKLKEIKK